MSRSEMLLIMRGSTSDETIFLPMADFLTLLSICFIFVALQFGVTPTVGVAEGVRVVKAGYGAGPSRPMDRSIAYVGILPESGRLIVRVILPQPREILDRVIEESAPAADDVAVVEWALESIATDSAITRIVVHFDSANAPDRAHRVANTMLMKAREQYEVTYSL